MDMADAIIARIPMRQVSSLEEVFSRDGNYRIIEEGYRGGAHTLFVKFPGVPRTEALFLGDANSEDGRTRKWNGSVDRPSLTDGSIAVTLTGEKPYLFHGYIKEGVIVVLEE